MINLPVTEAAPPRPDASGVAMVFHWTAGVAPVDDADAAAPAPAPTKRRSSAAAVTRLHRPKSLLLMWRLGYPVRWSDQSPRRC